MPSEAAPRRSFTDAPEAAPGRWRRSDRGDRRENPRRLHLLGHFLPHGLSFDAGLGLTYLFFGKGLFSRSTFTSSFFSGAASSFAWLVVFTSLTFQLP